VLSEKDQDVGKLAATGVREKIGDTGVTGKGKMKKTVQCELREWKEGGSLKNNHHWSPTREQALSRGNVGKQCNDR
jgi:hypothetical protein